ncbi:hypothetical protein M513_13862 [Trichuris suis]|uniref:Uncharacterized protein n=1 Tax=Trichuris suis TaxID=68888 RepID=A0A085LJW5_9BILA|nr:hypothetical protein M513_13862 [Trichuris suis]
MAPIILYHQHFLTGLTRFYHSFHYLARIILSKCSSGSPSRCPFSYSNSRSGSSPVPSHPEISRSPD